MVRKAGKEGYTIFHMSDLHYDGDNVEIFKQVLDRLLEVAPEYIFITGDMVDNPGDDMEVPMVMVREAMRQVEIEKGRRPILKAVPGNHDFFYKGIYGVRRTKQFYRNFTEEERGSECFPDDLLIVCTFDSNRVMEPRGGMWRRFIQTCRPMTHGLVIERDMDNFSEWIRDAHQNIKESEYQSFLKVALVHHHPMPTRYNFLPKRADEGYMMLENAGVFIYRLIEEDFDLILHGHRHYPQFCRAAYDNHEGKEKEIAVLSCGSSGKSLDDWIRVVGHNFNVIRVGADGSVVVQKYIKQGSGAFHPSLTTITVRKPPRGKAS